MLNTVHHIKCTSKNLVPKRCGTQEETEAHLKGLKLFVDEVIKNPNKTFRVLIDKSKDLLGAKIDTIRNHI